MFVRKRPLRKRRGAHACSYGNGPVRQARRGSEPRHQQPHQESPQAGTAPEGKDTWKRATRSAEVVRWVPAAPRRCRGSPPPRRLAIARNLSLTAALKICCKTRAHFKSWLVRRGRVCCAILPPTRRACSAQWRSQPCASQRGAAPCLPLQKRLAQPARALAFLRFRCTLRPRARRRHGQKKEARPPKQAVPGLR